MTAGDLVINLTGNTQPLAQAFSGAQQMLGNWASQLGSLVDVRGALGAAQEDIQAQRKLESVLLSTGGAAGVTAAEIAELAGQLQMTTNFADEATVSAAGILAAFESIKGDNFKQTLVVAQDLASVMEIDLTGATKMLGKALSDPAKGMQALRRAGVTFTEQQQAQIKAMLAANDAAGAQKFMLDTLAAKFGGAAAAMANPITILKNAWGEIQEQIGKALLPLISILASVVIPFLQQWGGEIAAVAVAIVGLVAVIKTIQFALRAVAIAEALVMSLGGPAAWATLAAGAAIFAGSVIAIDSAMDGVTARQDAAIKSAAGFNAQLDKTGAKATYAKTEIELLEAAQKNWTESIKEFSGETLGEKLIRIGDLAAAAGFEAEHAFERIFKPQIVNAATGIVTKIQDLNTEIRALNGNPLDNFDRAMEMINQGVPVGMAEEYEKLLDKRDELKKNKDALDEMKDSAKRVIDETRTPMEKFDTEVANLQKLFDAGLIDQETLERGTEAAKAKLPGTEKAGGGPIAGPAALEFGGREALSSIFAAMRGQSMQDQMVKTQERGNEIAEEIRDAILDMEGGSLVAGTI